MSDETDGSEEPPKKASKLPLIIGVVLALLGGGGGFFAVQTGMLGFGGADHAKDEAGQGSDHSDDSHASDAPHVDLKDVAFVEVPPLTVSLGPGGSAQHLRFRASLEVPSGASAEVTSVMPRVQDVLNGYLRALEPAELEAQGALIRLRAQMLRRVKLVVGEDRVKDLLVLEFVLN